jgi:hypothetical protein
MQVKKKVRNRFFIDKMSFQDLEMPVRPAFKPRAKIGKFPEMMYNNACVIHPGKKTNYRASYFYLIFRLSIRISMNFSGKAALASIHS